MQIRFLLGPAGSGKTRRCLDEIRQALLAAPDGPPLLLLAPKQATFQLERRLLEHPDLAGWSRLQILAFDRLARQILEAQNPVDLLPEEGRLMVLRALLRRHQPALRIFRASARLGGFAEELGEILREFQRHRIGPERLAALAARIVDHPALAAKLHDLGLLLRAYLDWLREHDVLDADRLPELAASALQRPDHEFALEALWLDGFAEMTPQETDLLAAVVRRTGRSCLTFCLAPEAAFPEPTSWLSTWAVVSRTLHACHDRLASLEGARIEVETLPATGQPDRFASCPALGFLAAHWGRPIPAPPEIQTEAARSVRLQPCADAEGEAVAAAREICRHVRGGGRYRDVAVLLRSLETHRPVLERVFLRYRIPYFVDRRESLAHHPLAELTRSSLRLAAFQWQHDDWFGALKSGLTPSPSAFVDTLENRALAFGWNGLFWPDQSEGADWPPDARDLLSATLVPFRAFQRRLGAEPSARQLAAAIRNLWEDLRVREQLEAWITPASAVRHRTAWEEILAWLEGLETGFDEERFPLAEWIPILDAGLSALTAGAIPPSQDQVLVGAIDRSRQPELQVALILGLNEGVFPAPAPTGGLLSDHERDQLVAHGASLGPTQRLRTGHERYYGYIACTRASQRLVVSWSDRAPDGKPSAPSVFVTWIRALLPGLEPETAPLPPPEAATPADELYPRTEHATELLPWLLARTVPTPLDTLAGDLLRRHWLRTFRSGAASEPPSPALFEALLGPEPEISVSALERLAACPFQFFAQHALRGSERERFEVDARQTGSLAHEILAAFHHAVTRRHRRWRDLGPGEAGRQLEDVAAQVLPRYRDGLFAATPEARWASARLVENLSRCAETMVAWMSTYALDPTFVELAFGTGCPLPPWRLAVDDRHALRIRGKIDRLDLVQPDPGPPRFCILDYKQRTPRVDEERMRAGIELQLVAYLLAATTFARAWVPEGRGTPLPAGMFYVGLRNRPGNRDARGAPATLDEERRRLFQHRGRFAASALPLLDANVATQPSGQFAARLRKDGRLTAHSDGMDDPAFESWLATIRDTLGDLGRRLLAGTLEVAPLRMGSYLACTGCPWNGVCRFDPRVDPYRRPAAAAHSPRVLA